MSGDREGAGGVLSIYQIVCKDGSRQIAPCGRIFPPSTCPSCSGHHRIVGLCAGGPKKRDYHTNFIYEVW